MEENFGERNLGLQEVRNLSIHIEDDSDRENEDNREDKRREEGTYDVPVYSPEPGAVGLAKLYLWLALWLLLFLLLCSVHTSLRGDYPSAVPSWSSMPRSPPRGCAHVPPS